MEDLSRRRFLGTAAATMLRPGLPKSPLSFSAALQASLEAKTIALDAMGPFFTPADGFVDMERLQQSLFAALNGVKYSLQQLARVKISPARGRDSLSPLEKLLTAEKGKLSLKTQEELLASNNEIESMLQPLGVDLKTWQTWYEEFLADDGEGLLHHQGIVHYNMGLSQYYMDCMNVPKLPSPLQTAVRKLCVALQESFPVHVPLERCSVLGNLLEENTTDPEIRSLQIRLRKTQPFFEEPQSISHTERVIQERTKVDLLPFEFDHHGKVRGNDVY